MPALNFMGRAWLVATDDLPVPMMCLMFIHTVWCVYSQFRRDDGAPHPSHSQLGAPHSHDVELKHAEPIVVEPTKI